MEDSGMVIYQWTAQDTEDLLEIATPVVEAYLDSLDADGLPGWSVYEHLLAARDAQR